MVLENNIDRFIGKLEMGKTFFEDAAVMLVKMIDEEPQVCERIVNLKRVPWLTMDVLNTFEAIGRKQLAVEAMFLPKHVIDRMIAYPVEEQARLAKAWVPVHNGNNKGATAGISKPVAQLNRNEAIKVLGPSGVRTLDQQIADAIDPKRNSLNARMDLSARIARKVWDAMFNGDFDFDDDEDPGNKELREKLIKVIFEELNA